MATIESKIESKKRELESLKRIADLTEAMKSQLFILSEQIKQIETDGSRVADIMRIWDLVTQSISAAGLGLLRYGEDNYKVGDWKEENNNKSPNQLENQAMPLPEGLVRVSASKEEPYTL